MHISKGKAAADFEGELRYPTPKPVCHMEPVIEPSFEEA